MEELFAYLCVHGCSSAWSRLKWIADVAALLASADQQEVARLYRHAEELGARRACATTLLLAEILLRVPIPGAIEGDVRKDKVAGLLVKVALNTLVRGKGTMEVTEGKIGTAPIHLYHLLMQPGLGYKTSELRRKSISPVDLLEFPMPRALWFLYPLLSMPFWIWRRIRSGTMFRR
jgi:hypothetical protein